MASTLAPDATFRRTITVDRTRIVDFSGPRLAVYGTPALINDVEFACRDFMLPHLDQGQDSVGIAVSVEHLAAALPGSEVEIDIRVTRVSGRRVYFTFSVLDFEGTIATGTHGRFIVDLDVSEKRLRDKRQRAQTA